MRSAESFVGGSDKEFLGLGNVNELLNDDVEEPSCSSGFVGHDVAALDLNCSR